MKLRTELTQGGFWTCPQNPSCKIPRGDPRGSNFFWEDGKESLKKPAPWAGGDSAPKRIAIEGTSNELLTALNNLRGDIADLKTLITANLNASEPQPMTSPAQYAVPVPKFGQH